MGMPITLSTLCVPMTGRFLQHTKEGSIGERSSNSGLACSLSMRICKYMLLSGHEKDNSELSTEGRKAEKKLNILTKKS